MLRVRLQLERWRAGHPQGLRVGDRPRRGPNAPSRRRRRAVGAPVWDRFTACTCAAPGQAPVAASGTRAFRRPRCGDGASRGSAAGAARACVRAVPGLGRSAAARVARVAPSLERSPPGRAFQHRARVGRSGSATGPAATAATDPTNTSTSATTSTATATGAAAATGATRMGAPPPSLGASPASGLDPSQCAGCARPSDKPSAAVDRRTCRAPGLGTNAPGSARSGLGAGCAHASWSRVDTTHAESAATGMAARFAAARPAARPGAHPGARPAATRVGAAAPCRASWSPETGRVAGASTAGVTGRPGGDLRDDARGPTADASTAASGSSAERAHGAGLDGLVASAGVRRGSCRSHAGDADRGCARRKLHHGPPRRARGAPASRRTRGGRRPGARGGQAPGGPVTTATATATHARVLGDGC